MADVAEREVAVEVGHGCVSSVFHFDGGANDWFSFGIFHDTLHNTILLGHGYAIRIGSISHYWTSPSHQRSGERRKHNLLCS